MLCAFAVVQPDTEVSSSYETGAAPVKQQLLIPPSPRPLHPPLYRDSWVASAFWLLWVMLLWLWVYKWLFEPMFSFVGGIYPEVKLLNHVIILCLIFWGIAILFSTAAAPFYILSNNSQETSFSTSSSILVNSLLSFFF